MKKNELREKAANLVSKYILEGITKDLEEETKKRYLETPSVKAQKHYKSQVKSYINKNASQILEICKKITYKKIEKNLSFISQKKIEKIYKNTTIQEEEETNTKKYILENEEKILKKEHQTKDFLFDILSNSKKAYKSYNMLENANTKEEEKTIYSHYIAKSTSHKKLDKNVVLYNHDNNGAIENFEDLTQTAFCSMLENTKRLFLKTNGGLLITKKAYYSILQAIDKLIKRTEKEEKTASYEDLQEKNLLTNLIFASPEEEKETKKDINFLNSIEFTQAQKTIIKLLYKTNLNDKDIYNNLNISKQAYYKHIRNIRKLIETYQTQTA